jgi:serine/threonine kinase 38
MYIFCGMTLQAKLNSKDLSFVGYTYKNFDAVKGLKHAGFCLLVTSFSML